ncbi:MAG TPA: hypothetical protein VFQ70_03705 [Candidatus Saccharimonadaceae bacterium]|nr:hypothetical protein [Candidatus Saccharimonadaceae bacterium]
MKPQAKRRIRGGRFGAWLLSLVVGFIVRRIMKRLGAAGEALKSGKRDRKYVKNKAD